MNVQHAAEDAIENQLRQFGRDYHATQAATVVSDLDGGVRAMVGGRDYGASQFNRAVDAYRQPGSSFKPDRRRAGRQGRRRDRRSAPPGRPVAEFGKNHPRNRRYRPFRAETRRGGAAAGLCRANGS
jgi:cell division protein FtsI/penicillin-binding protein 2